MKKLIVVALLALLIITVRYITADHWWRKVANSKVTYAGQPPASAQIYRSRNGDLLINLESYGDSMYVVDYFDKVDRWFVSHTNSPNWHFLPYFAISENVPPPSVEMGGAKIEIDPELIVQQNSVEFTSQKRVRVRVTW